VIAPRDRSRRFGPSRAHFLASALRPPHTRLPTTHTAPANLVALARRRLSPLNRRLNRRPAYLDGSQQPPRLARPPPARTSKRLSTHTYAGLLFEHETRPRPGGYPRRAACARHGRYLGGGGDAASRVRRDGRICWLKDRSTRLVTSERGSSAVRGRGGGS
jgi:hypothetical protein